jgi:hypothetical protein
MCLLSKYADPKVATEDIEVIKILVAYSRPHLPISEWVYVTPYVRAGINLNSMQVPLKFNYTPDIRNIGEGFVHSFALLPKSELSLHICLKELSRIRGQFHRIFMFKAFIPKNTEYYISYDETSYASTALFVTDKRLDICV